MAHHQFALDGADGLQRDADHNEGSGAADCQSAQRGNVGQDQGQSSDDCQEDSTHHGDLAQNLLDEVGSGLTGAEAGDEAAVLLHVVSHLNGVELDGGVEVGEGKDQQDVDDDISCGAGSKPTVGHVEPETFGLAGETGDGSGDTTDG